MTCETFQILVQDLSTSVCFVSNFEIEAMRRRTCPARIPQPICRPIHAASQQYEPEIPPVVGTVATNKEAEPADKPGSVVGSHSSRPCVTAGLQQPTRRHRGSRHCLPIWSCSRWGLPCRPVARLAVRSYRTISPLPDPGTPKNARPSAVSFCCTVRRLAPPRRYLAPYPVEPGLSSASSCMQER